MSRRSLRQIWASRLLRGALGVAMGALLAQLPLDYLENYFYDLRMSLKPTSPTSGEVVTVAIDSSTLKALQRDPNAPEHLALIRNLRAAQPSHIIYLIDPLDIPGTESERRELGRTMADTPEFRFGLNDLPPADRTDLLKLPEPYARVKVEPAPTTMDKFIFGKDSVTRRLILAGEGIPTLHTRTVQEKIGRGLKDYRGRFTFADSDQVYIDFRPTGTYKPLSFHDVSEGKISPESLQGKIVLVGRDAMESTRDYILTPFSRNPVAMSSLEMHANMLDTLLLNRAPLPSPVALRYILTALIALLTVYVVLSARPLQGLALLAAATGGYLLFAYVIFAAFALWLPVAHPLLAVLVSYYFLIPYRLIMENRKSWEYYQKNKLLTQVEELKSNFLRMMSHDLRTPLARIQGMAHVVLADGNPLSPTQRQAVQSISASSEELSDFIGSILSLGRIESKEIKLHLKSRDINSLLSEVLRKADDLAKRRHIEILTEFEPMFSFKFDPDLLRQVFTNLIENAIKYSPEGSKILVSTEEVGGKAVVQVADQGCGIAQEDQPFVFDKFFRSRSVRQTEVTGSGLGLYLVRYFVELHQGQVEVESEIGKGSTFTVSLPMIMDLPKELQKSNSLEGAKYV